jgi:tetratricopeptide (TPR) repeat protein
MGRGPHPSRGVRMRGMIRKVRIAAGFAVLAAIMVGLYAGCPTLFSVDLAKPPYIEANNLEITRVYARAIPKYQYVIDKYPTSQYVSYAELGIANCYRRLGDSDKAAALYDELISKYGADEKMSSLVLTAMKNEAENFRELGQTDKAVAAFQAIVERFPQSVDAEEARATLAALAPKNDAASAKTADEQAVPQVVKVVKLAAPAKLKKGEDGTLFVELKNVGTKVLYDVTIQTDITYWNGLQVVSIKPNPISVQEFWGTRRWAYKDLQPGAILTFQVAVKGIAVGTYASVVKVEASMEDAGVNEKFSTTVEQ